MIYQQTTQVPNQILDTHLPLLTEAELKMLLVIVRQTNGWVDKRTGLRKTRDRISHGQFMKKTGLCRRVISKTLQNLISKGLIQVTCQYGNILDRPEDRKGVTKMFYSFQTEVPRPRIRPMRTQGVRSIGDILNQARLPFLDKPRQV
jgi:hypothetical protein